MGSGFFLLAAAAGLLGLLLKGIKAIADFFDIRNDKSGNGGNGHHYHNQRKQPVIFLPHCNRASLIFVKVIIYQQKDKNKPNKKRPKKSLSAASRCDFSCDFE